MGLHKDLTGADLHVNKVHADTHEVGGTDPLALSESQVTNLTTDLDAFNVKNYGAIGNGIVDDTVAFQAAIAAAHAAGAGTVRIPSGNYRITDTLVLWTGISVIGNNHYPVRTELGISQTTITFAPTTERDLFDLVTNAVYANYVGNVYIGGIYLLGDGGTFARYALYSSAANSLFENLGIKSFQDGIYCNKTMTNKYRDIYISFCTHACIYTNTVQSTSDVFDNVVMRKSPWGAILRNVFGFRFMNCLFESLDIGGVNIYREGQMIEFVSTYGENVPATHGGDNYAMFYINHDGGGLGTGSVIISGVTTFGGNIGSFIDVGYTGKTRQVSVTNAIVQYFVNGIKASPNMTALDSIELKGIQMAETVVNPYVETVGKIFGLDTTQLKFSFEAAAPLSVSDAGTPGEVRILPDGIYVCSGTPLAINGEFEADTTGWTGSGATVSHETDSPLVGAGSLKMVLTADAGNVSTPLTTIVGHQYLVVCLAKSTAAAGRVCRLLALTTPWTNGYALDCSAGSTNLSVTFTATDTATSLVGFLVSGITNEIMYMDTVNIIDLSVPVWKKAALAEF